MTGYSVSQRLHVQLEQVIAGTEPGERLPSEPALAEQLGVSRATLREVMRTFETQGRIQRRQGSGTFVTHPPHVIESGLELLESIHTLAERSGISVSLGSLDIDRCAPTDEECRALGLNEDDQAIKLNRVILAEGRPVAYLIDVLPDEILSSDDLGDDFNGSVLDLLLRRGDPPLFVSRTEINAVQAPSKVARAMGIQRGDVLLCFVANLFTTDSKAIDHSISYFLPGYFRFHVVRKVG